MSRILSFSLAISCFLFVSTIVRATTDVHYCDKNEEYEVKVQGVDILPYPISRGEQTTFSISANNTDDAISSGKLVIEVSYFGWRIHSETDDLCEKTKCPVAIGDFLVSHSQVLPIFTPPGTYSLKMKMLDGQKKELTCIKFSFDVGFGSSVADI
uniref:Putative phosphatidylglycerol/phosphatidylinositol transfer protein n=1 Tax=Noccaea caerulescens TaxID=107243 RepID=A0A1J3H0D6_NOCCA